MSRTFNVDTNTVTNTNTGEPVAPQAPRTVCLTELLAESDLQIRSAILDSFVSSLNMSLLAQCKQEVMWGSHKVSNDPTWEEFDKHLEQKEIRANDSEFAASNGGKPKINAADVAADLGKLRAFAIKTAFEANTARFSGLPSASVREYTPRPLWESMAWLVEQLPTDANAKDQGILLLAKALKKDPATIAVVRNEMFKAEKAQLIAAAPKIIGLAEQFTDVEVDAEIAEAAFDALPAITQINIFTAACNAVVSAYTRAFKQLLRGRMHAAGDMPICEALYARALEYREQLLIKHAAEVAEYEDNGSALKALKTLP